MFRVLEVRGEKVLVFRCLGFRVQVLGFRVQAVQVLWGWGLGVG